MEKISAITENVMARFCLVSFFISNTPYVKMSTGKRGRAPNSYLLIPSHVRIDIMVFTIVSSNIIKSLSGSFLCLPLILSPPLLYIISIIFANIEYLTKLYILKSLYRNNI